MGKDLKPKEYKLALKRLNKYNTFFVNQKLVLSCKHAGVVFTKTEK